MTDANTIFRDYVTDGDSGSGRYEPQKSDIRDWGMRTQGGDLPPRSEIGLLRFPAVQTTIQTSGYSSPGDGGAGVYTREASEPPYGGVKSADGAWWGLSSTVIRPEMFGSITSGSDCTAAVNAAIAYLNNSGGNSAELHFRPQTQYVAAAGFTTEIARSDFWIDGHGAEFVLTSGPLFTFGDRAASYQRGGVRNLMVTGSSADGTSRVVKAQGFAGGRLENFAVDRIAGLITLGHDASYKAQGWEVSNCRGNILEIDDAVAIDCAHGGGAKVHSVRCSSVERSGTVPTFPTDRTGNHAQADTIAIRIGDTQWDTLQITASNFGHFRYGFKSDITTASNYLSNVKASDTFFDYCGLNAVKLTTAASVTYNNIEFNNCWFYSIDDHAVLIDGTSGGATNIRFLGGEVRSAGKNGLRASCTTMENCKGVGLTVRESNRVTGNTGTDQDGIVILANGFAALDCTSGQAHSSVAGWQARYGFTMSADLDDVAIQNSTGDGSAGGFNIASFTTAQTNAKVTGNRKVGAAQPDYVSPGSIAAPSSGVAQTWAQPYDAVIYVRDAGATVTSFEFNGFNVGAGDVSMRLSMGQTWELTYSSGTPTVYQQELA